MTKGEGHSGTTEVVPSRRALPSCPPTPFVAARWSRIPMHRDYAFAGYTQPLGSSWIVFAQKQISGFARNDNGLGFVEACLDTLHLVIPRSRSDEESAVSPTLGQKQISRSRAK